MVKSCEDFLNSRFRGFIFRKINEDRTAKSHLRILILKPKNVFPICALFFKQAYVRSFYFFYLSDSFLKKNSISFTSPNETDFGSEDLDSNIKQFSVLESYYLHINWKLVNPLIFSKTEYFMFRYHVDSIQNDVFKPFYNIRKLSFDPLNLMNVVRKQGIEWLKSVNSDLNVDLEDKYDLKENEKRIVNINVGFNVYFLINSKKNLAYESDFCLFVDYPFDQLVFLGEIYDERNREKNFSCTEMWLYQHYSATRYFLKYSKSFVRRLRVLKFENCNFKKRISICNRTNFHTQLKNTHSSSNLFTVFDFMIVLEFFILVGSSLSAVYIAITNLATIYVIFHKENIKTTREKHFIYMSLHCLANTLIASFQLLSLMSECLTPFGFYCSSVRQVIAIQYVKIVFGEYLNSLSRLISYLTYLAFSICRMSKVGNDHEKLIMFINEKSVKKYMFVCIVISAGLSVPKAFQFDINLDESFLEYPMTFLQNSARFWTEKKIYVVITVANAVHDLISYLVFILIQIVVDLILIKKMMQALNEKEEKMREIKMQGLDKIIKENKKSKRRVIRMVIFSSTFSLITKVPSIVTSLNDVRLIIRNFVPIQEMQFFKFNPNTTTLYFDLFCYTQKSCLIFKKFGNFLYLLSLSSTFHFLKRFDKNFEAGCDQVFSTKSQTTMNHKNDQAY